MNRLIVDTFCAVLLGVALVILLLVYYADAHAQPKASAKQCKEVTQPVSKHRIVPIQTDMESEPRCFEILSPEPGPTSGFGPAINWCLVKTICKDNAT